MKLDDLLTMVGALPWFDLATLVQLTGARRKTLTHQLSRLTKAGKLIRLRRGMYVFDERYRHTPVQPAALAAAIYRPSYLSGVWALSFYGMIPESVPVFTSVTTRTPRRFENRIGTYVYRNVKLDLFFGSRPVEIAGGPVQLASPEKALVDHWHLEPGEWTEERMVQMRFATGGVVDGAKLEALVRKIGKPRLLRALVSWRRVVAGQSAGEVQL